VVLKCSVKWKIPVLGVVENMSVHICSNCGHQEAFGLAPMAERVLPNDYDTVLLGQLPLHKPCASKPMVASPRWPQSRIRKWRGAIWTIARRVGAELSKRERHLSGAISSVSSPTIGIRTKTGQQLKLSPFITPDMRNQHEH